MSLKQKFFNYFNNLIFSSIILWGMLIVLSLNGLKPEIIIKFFFFFSLFLFLILYYRQTLIFLIPKLNKFNCFLKSTDNVPVLNFLTKRQLFLVFLIQLLILLKRFPQFFRYLLINNFFWLVLTITGLFFDIFVFKFTSDLLILLLSCLSIILIIRFKFEGKQILALGFLLLVVCPLFLIFKMDFIAEKSAVWACLFLFVGILKIFLSDIKEHEDREDEE